MTNFHFYVEVKSPGGGWRVVFPDEAPKAYDIPKTCWDFYTVLAGVHSHPDIFLTPISSPRGIPPDASTHFQILRSAANLTSTIHSDSWLGAEELWNYPWEAPYWTEALRDYATLERYRPWVTAIFDLGPDTRIVFWFSNQNTPWK